MHPSQWDVTVPSTSSENTMMYYRHNIGASPPEQVQVPMLPCGAPVYGDMTPYLNVNRRMSYQIGSSPRNTQMLSLSVPQLQYVQQYSNQQLRSSPMPIGASQHHSSTDSLSRFHDAQTQVSRFGSPGLVAQNRMHLDCGGGMCDVLFTDFIQLMKSSSKCVRF